MLGDRRVRSKGQPALIDPTGFRFQAQIGGGDRIVLEQPEDDAFDAAQDRIQTSKTSGTIL